MVGEEGDGEQPLQRSASGRRHHSSSGAGQEQQQHEQPAEGQQQHAEGEQSEQPQQQRPRRKHQPIVFPDPAELGANGRTDKPPSQQQQQQQPATPPRQKQQHPQPAPPLQQQPGPQARQQQQQRDKAPFSQQPGGGIGGGGPGHLGPPPLGPGALPRPDPGPLRPPPRSARPQAPSEQLHPLPGRGPPRFFMIKSASLDNFLLSRKLGVWATQAHNERKLDEAFKRGDEVLLVMSVNNTGDEGLGLLVTAGGAWGSGGVGDYRVLVV